MTFNQKISVIKKLNSAGIYEEKKLLATDLEALLEIPGITIADLKIVAEIKKAVKGNKLFSLLSEGGFNNGEY